MRDRKKIDKNPNGNVAQYPYERDLLTFNTQYCAMSPYADSTVVRTPDLVLKGSLYSKANRFRSEEYLLNYRTNNNYIGFKLGVANFFQSNAAVTAANLELGEELDNVVFLSEPKKIKAHLGMTIKARRSVRNYCDNAMSEAELSAILYYSQGVSGETQAYRVPGGPDKLKLRNSPSGGGLYPIKLYACLENVKGIKDGIYKYYPYSHSLKPVRDDMDNIDVHKFAEFGAIQAEKVNLILLYVYDMNVNTRKYGDGAMAYAFIEAGEIAQNAQLVSTALGYGSCDIGGYDKQYVEQTLNIDGITKHNIHLTIIGKEAD